ncbi:hypothetical protein TRVA0_010S02300 [Trichomonascus vanleenenianus]|uniref:N-acetylglucosamine kinase n=1 Tax=Trichomonascus vanleenenianus TaxID=2268995 RepID=UPI003ECB1B54
MEPVVVVIDAGGTKTRLVVATPSTRESPEVFTGPGSNVSTVGLDSAIAIVGNLVAQAGLNERNIAAVWAGFAGVGTHDSDTYKGTLGGLRGLFAQVGHFTLTSDANLLAGELEFSTANRAIGLIAGTGSIGMVFDREFSMIARAGGFGSVLGDEGSGYYIGLAALKKLVQANDSMLITGRGRLSELQRDILDKFALEPGANLHIRIINSVLPDRSSVASITPLVFAAALTGTDRDARKIIEDAAKHLRFVIEQLLDICDPSSTLLILGGSLTSIPQYRNLVLHGLPRFHSTHVVTDPAISAANALLHRYVDPSISAD